MCRNSDKKGNPYATYSIRWRSPTINPFLKIRNQRGTHSYRLHVARLPPRLQSADHCTPPGSSTVPEPSRPKRTGPCRPHPYINEKRPRSRNCQLEAKVEPHEMEFLRHVVRGVLHPHVRTQQGVVPHAPLSK